VDGSAAGVTRNRLKQVFEELVTPERPLSFDLQPGRPLKRRPETATSSGRI
jgi:hypothetical protein